MKLTEGLLHAPLAEKGFGAFGGHCSLDEFVECSGTGVRSPNLDPSRDPGFVGC